MAQHSHFLDAPIYQQFHLSNYLPHRAAHLPPPAVGDDAESTHKVAAVDDRDVTGHIGLGRRQSPHAAFPIKANALTNQVQQGAVLLGTHENVDKGETASQIVGFGANHAAHQSNHPAGFIAFPGLHPSEVPHHLVLGLLAHDTGVQDDQVGLTGGFHLM